MVVTGELFPDPTMLSLELFSHEILERIILKKKLN